MYLLSLYLYRIGVCRGVSFLSPLDQAVTVNTGKRNAIRTASMHVGDFLGKQCEARGNPYM